MCIFKKVIVGNSIATSLNVQYIPNAYSCFQKYLKFIQDDFSDVDNLEKFLLFLKSNQYFWVITDKYGCFAGFVYLDNFVGRQNYLYSAELTTCFEKWAWGDFVRKCAEKFLNKTFEELRLEKIVAQIYPDNFRVSNLLKSCGFIYESTLKNETLRLGKMQDIDVYGLYRGCYRNLGE